MNPWERYQQLGQTAPVGPWTQYQPTPEDVGMLEDIVRSAGSGLAQGVANLAGLGSDLGSLARTGAAYAYGGITGTDTSEFRQRESERPRLGSETIKGAIDQAGNWVEDRLGIGATTDYAPQTTPGDYARTVGEFVAASPYGKVGQVLKYGVLPALVSETAGQMTEGSPLEPMARAGAAIATGAGAGLLSRPTAAQRVVNEAARANPAELQQAQRLMQQGQQTGIPLTVAEATNNPRLLQMQRYAEQSPRSAPQMGRFMQQRPQQVQQAGQRMLDQIAPPTPSAARLGGKTQDVARRSVDTARKAINQRSEPLYSVAEAVPVPPQEFQSLMADPAFQMALRGVRSDPILNQKLANLPDDSVGVLNAVKKRLDALEAGARVGENADLERAAAFGTTAGRVRDIASQVSPEYRQALTFQRRARQGILEPAKRGPLGQMAATDDVARQGDALLPSNPVPGQSEDVRKAAARALAEVGGKDAMSRVVRNRIEQAFNEANQSNIAGPNEWGGAKFAANMRGNAEQKRNLAQVLRQVAGDKAAQNADETMSVMEATGRRLRPNSATAFNQQMADEMGGMGTQAVTAARNALDPLGIPKRIGEAIERGRMGRATEDLATILTDPQTLHNLQRMTGGNLDKVPPEVIAALMSARSIQSLQNGY